MTYTQSGVSTTTSINTLLPLPTAHITVGNDRLKVYHNATLYMKDGTQFKFELFNPRTNDVLAEIHINGNPISKGGIIVKPGQRIYLDRYIDVAKKFKFETYNVEDTPEVNLAIQNNGNIKVVFYDEQLHEVTSNTSAISYVGYDNFQSPDWTTDSPHVIYSDTCTSNLGIIGKCAMYSAELESKPTVETGKVEMGDSSKQEFQISMQQFNTWPINTVEYQILPESIRAVTVNEIKEYCASCGYRVRKQSWAFCPKCGFKR